MPKIIPRTHNDYYHNAKGIAVTTGMIADDRFVVFMPMMHNGPLVCQILPIHMTGGAIVPAVPKPEEVVRAVSENRGTRTVFSAASVGMLDESAVHFRVLVIKTRCTIPYSSVFLQLDCAYWSGDQESTLRKVMSSDLMD